MMKLRFTLLPVILCIVFAFTVKSQNGYSVFNSSDINYTAHSIENNNPCINAQEYALLEKECMNNMALLGLDKSSFASSAITILHWPIQAASNIKDCDIYSIGAYVDQNTSTGAIQDFNCGIRTYDGHRGTDIAAWPYGFYKMENNHVEVIAAAPGIIIQKADGNFDRNCGTNNLTANSIIVKHSDGSQALYWHMKKNSLTTKVVGDTVAVGEYLGIIGSSGSSTGPHLHFEIWTGNNNSTYKDPFSGPCNLLNSSSWWKTQKPHSHSTVIKVSVNTTDIVLPGCPNTEIPNESDNFVVPFQGPGLSPGYAKFYIFLRDDSLDMTADCKILNPNGTTFSSWTYTSIGNAKTSIRGFSKLLPTTPGLYTFQASYNGTICSKNFNISQVVSTSNITSKDPYLILYNLANKTITISSQNVEDDHYEISFVPIAGNIVFKTAGIIEVHSNLKVIQTTDLPNGIYFLSIHSTKNRYTKKVFIGNP